MSIMASYDLASSFVTRYQGKFSLFCKESLRNWNIQSLLRRRRRSPEIVRETAWLDGVRGVAAFLVMNHHAHYFYWGSHTCAPFGASNDTSDWWRLPFIRLWFCSGNFQVNLFFILSGFVLSWSCLGALHNCQVEKFAQLLGSAIFRRWLRLYVPCFAIASIYMLLRWFEVIRNNDVSLQASFLWQVWDFIKQSAKFASPFELNRTRWTSAHQYAFITWTIPFEFAGSLLVFAILLATSRVPYRKRFILVLGIAIWALIDSRWVFSLFGSGVAFADYVRQHGGFEQLSRESRSRTVFWSLLFVVGLYLAGMPPLRKDEPNPGYEFLFSIIPPNWINTEDGSGGARFWWLWASILIFTGACHLNMVRRAFNTRLCRFLGKISFMLYLTHPIFHPFALYWMSVVLSIFGRHSNGRPTGSSTMYEITTCVIYVILYSSFICVSCAFAHLCQKLVDEPSIRFAKWVEQVSTRDCRPFKAHSRIHEAGLHAGGNPGLLGMEQLPTHGMSAATERYRDGEGSVSLLSDELYAR